MPPEGGDDPGSADVWLRYARSDLALASAPAPEGVLLETLCFHAQQAAEKAIQAVLINRGIAAPRLHSIERLVQLLPEDVTQPEDLKAAAELTAYATTLRYPTDEDPVTSEELAQAVALSETVVDWAARTICPPTG